ncbi:MAG TPA: prepilin-type N-terminal cleavage/methylation domain-containing protein [Campylobacterales bacterium]|nr:prepilin-type N-terminal cleavage/methylation domain-containing protein [Campylobacterales bacterium]
MKNQKKAFTMIELIFVIVIIGIVASVAIPKLSATRDDAKVSILAKAIQSVKSEVASSILANNKVPTTTQQMIDISNTLRDLSSFVIVNNKTINIVDTDNSSVVCKTITIDDGNISNIKLLLQDGNGTTAICKGLQKLIPDNNTAFTIAGNLINY